MVFVALAAAIGGKAAGAGRAFLRRAGARPPEPSEVTRFANIVEGLAARLRAPVPRLLMCDDAAPNLAAVWARGPAILLTTGAAEQLTRTELEAMAAFALVRLASGEARRSTMLLALPAPRPPVVGSDLDTAAAAVTRYPPALASAIRRSGPRTGRDAALWIVGEPSTHVSAAERIAAIEDL